MEGHKLQLSLVAYSPETECLNEYNKIIKDFFLLCLACCCDTTVEVDFKHFLVFWMGKKAIYPVSEIQIVVKRSCFRDFSDC